MWLMLWFVIWTLTIFLAGWLSNDAWSEEDDAEYEAEVQWAPAYEARPYDQERDR